jgi:hypothetical protein
MIMTQSRRLALRVAAAACAALSLVPAAEAVDLRDWGRKFPTAERFQVLSQFAGEAVLDKETQLVWARTPGNALSSWYSANNTDCTRTPIGGRHGWRLPSLNELMTLIDPAASAPMKLPSGHPFIGVTPNGQYWTSSNTPFNANPHWMTALRISDGNSGNYDKSQLAAMAWCVRGAAP